MYRNDGISQKVNGIELIGKEGVVSIFISMKMLLFSLEKITIFLRACILVDEMQ